MDLTVLYFIGGLIVIGGLVAWAVLRKTRQEEIPDVTDPASEPLFTPKYHVNAPPTIESSSSRTYGGEPITGTEYAPKRNKYEPTLKTRPASSTGTSNTLRKDDGGDDFATGVVLGTLLDTPSASVVESTRYETPTPSYMPPSYSSGGSDGGSPVPEPSSHSSGSSHSSHSAYDSGSSSPSSGGGSSGSDYSSRSDYSSSPTYDSGSSSSGYDSSPSSYSSSD